VKSDSSPDYLSLVKELQQQLQLWQEAIALQSQLDKAIAEEWQVTHDQIQSFFQCEMVNGDNAEITPQFLSLQVEINKQLKMLGVDLTMLRSSRSAATWQKRHQQIGDRLNTLQKYCEFHFT